jgi:uncharacterized RDD family membrane protein YckC
MTRCTEQEPSMRCVIIDYAPAASSILYLLVSALWVVLSTMTSIINPYAAGSWWILLWMMGAILFTAAGIFVHWRWGSWPGKTDMCSGGVDNYIKFLSGESISPTDRDGVCDQ